VEVSTDEKIENPDCQYFNEEKYFRKFSTSGVLEFGLFEVREYIFF